MKIFIELESIEEATEFVRWKNQKNSKTRLCDVGLTVRTEKCLAAAGFKFLEDAQATPDAVLLKITDFGRLSLRELRDTKPTKTR